MHLVLDSTSGAEGEGLSNNEIDWNLRKSFSAPSNPICTLRPGECYQIGVGGINASEGDYVLSINCTIVSTTSAPVSTSATTATSCANYVCPDALVNDADQAPRS